MVPTFSVVFRDAGRDIDGLPLTSIFKSIYVSNSAGFAVFEPTEKKQD
jgi:hypothetical protein